jgi:hypothetical protein
LIINLYKNEWLNFTMTQRFSWLHFGRAIPHPEGLIITSTTPRLDGKEGETLHEHMQFGLYIHALKWLRMSSFILAKPYKTTEPELSNNLPLIHARFTST